MPEMPTGSERNENEVAEQVAGSSAVLTDEGWEEADYTEPGLDWVEQPDGSYLSPDGTIRSWPLAEFEPE
jgi:hypothetical protein